MKKDERAGLNLKQQRCAELYRADPARDRVKAYCTAYGVNDREYARKAFSRLMVTNEDFRGYIDRCDQEDIASLKIHAKDILRVDAIITSSDVRKLVDGEGVTLPPHKLPDDIAEAVSGVDITEKITNVDGQEHKEITYKYKFWDKGQAQNRLYKYNGMFEKHNEQKESKLSPEDLLAALKQKS